MFTYFIWFYSVLSAWNKSGLNHSIVWLAWISKTNGAFKVKPSSMKRLFLCYLVIYYCSRNHGNRSGQRDQTKKIITIVLIEKSTNLETMNGSLLSKWSKKTLSVLVGCGILVEYIMDTIFDFSKFSRKFRLPFNTCTDTVYECDAFMEHV